MMARPFPNTFEQDSPMTPQSASSISYQTNVNRQKTRKWAEAKTVNYGGDDWGDDDEYDDPPPPISKPTGFRQQGQGLQSSTKLESPGLDNPKKYGELPPLPGANDPRGRSNSFDADDEKRNFSSMTARQPSPASGTPTSAGPATRFSQITGVPSARNASGPPALSIQTQQPQTATGLRKTNQMVSPVSGSPHPDIPHPGRVNTGESSIVSPASKTPSTVSEFHARRDFSPSAVPPPLASHVSAAPQSATESPATRFPVRKSSLSQTIGPSISDISRPSPAETTPKPWVSGRSASPGASVKSPATPTGKALPFIRPADIYRRAEEERRQSLDSGRPSMDSVTGAKASDRSDSPAMPQVREKISSDSLGGTGRRRTSFEGEDGSESGRRLMPMLEPVRERKSEYGFEGVNVGEHGPQTEPAHGIQSVESATDTETNEEEARRLSISPKLPDLTRMSGFGMDLFAQQSTENFAPTTKVADNTPTASTATLSPVTDQDLTLRTQPSFGFRSVVNQAFDRSDDTSVPPTPASNTGSDPRRTDSQSTGTTGISPIMSRVPSGAVPDSRNRDISNSSILEVVNEPGSPEMEVADLRGRDIPGFRPGYRRDISTPRNENSPARTPDLAKTKIITSGQHAAVLETTTEAESADSEPLRPPRPIAEREASFRPSLPGGWTSYATTAQSENPSQAPSVRGEIPAQESSAFKIQGDDLDITPTTTRHSLPVSQRDAFVAGAAGAALASAAGAALGQHSNDKLSAVHITPSRSPSRKAVPSHNALPTPDPAMAPSGNLYSTNEPDPRLMPKLEQAPANTQLRLDAVNRDVSAHSSAAPTPPPKDSSEYEVSNCNSEQLASLTAPLKQRSPIDTGEDDTLLPPSRPQMLPALSTDTHPNDEENDKLRKEIVKSLTPRPSDAHSRDDALLFDEFDEANYLKQGHESTYLPREYDNYWASTSGDEQAVPRLPDTVADPTKTDVLQTQATEQEHSVADSPIIAPLSPRRPEQSSLEPPRPTLQSRFSWEDSNERVNTSARANDEVSEVSAASSPIHVSRNDDAFTVPNPSSSHTELVEQEEIDAAQVHGSRIAKDPIHTDHNTHALLAAAGAASLAAAAIPQYDSNPPENKSRRLSLAEEKNPRVSSHPVSPTPPEDEHPARAAQSYFSPSPNQNSPVPAPSTVSPVASPVLPHQFAPPQAPLLTFKQIVAMRTPPERINAFDTTRERFATMNSGLNDWMMQLQTQHPEYADANPSFAGSRISVPGTGKSKLGRSIGGTAPPLQQPYYQQYLNASSPTTPSTPAGPRPGPGSGPSPGPSMAAGSQQGFNSNSTKITSQQVQAKGKELLHSAGIFGGKAGKAGKGLLAKGKSRFLGGGDKTASPPKPKNEQPRQERRSSWGLPLSLSRSSGQHDGSARQSKEFIPPFDRPRAATATSSNRSFTAPQLPDVSTGESLGILSGALSSMNHEPERTTQEPSTIRQVQSDSVDEQFEARDTLGVPAPIGKHQPSWDPYNATPIAEEEVFQYEERPKQRQLSSDVGNRHGSLAVPPGAKSSSERSNSDDTHFYSAHEEESDIPHDWVMVSPDPETKDVFSNTTPAPEVKLVTSAESDNRKSIDAPVTSILNRPRGSSYEIPSTPPSAKGIAPQTAQPAPLVAAPLRFTPSPPKLVQAELEKQAGSSSFLPPIRRTSTFGLGFGSRHTKPRFPLEDEDEHNILDNTAEPIPAALNRSDPVVPVASLPEVKSSLLSDHVRTISDTPISAPAPYIGIIAQTSQQAPPSTNAAPSPRPLSFVQTSGAQEVLHTPFRASEQRPVVDEALLHGPPIYNQPRQTIAPSMRQAPKEQSPPIDMHQNSPSQGSLTRPILTQGGSSEYSQKSTQSQRTVLPQQVVQQKPNMSGSPDQMQRAGQNQRAMGPPPAPQQHLPPLASRAADVLQRPEFRESQVEWRPNRPKAVDPPPPVPPTYWKEVDVPAPRHSNSWEPQRQRGNSGSIPSYSQRPDVQHIERPNWSNPPVSQSPYQQPPSSAQRYPELFRPGQPVGDAPRDNVDLPAHYYQAPITRADAFLPRQQTNEYQIPGVGPPTDDPRNGASKRNSGFFKEIGGKLSRASSRDRRTSISRDREAGSPSPVRPLDSRGNDYAESSVASEGEQEQRKRRSSFFGNISRNSTSGLGPPQSRESVIAHNSASRTDLLASPRPSSPVHQDRKRSIFGGGSKDPKDRAKKLVRAPTGPQELTEKKNRFSGLSSMFKASQSARAPSQERPQATRELLYNERQPIESPQIGAQRPSVNTPPPSTPRASSQSRHVLQKFTSSSSPRSSPRPDAKTRRSSGSASGLLGGLMGRRSHQQDRGSDDSRSQGSSSQARTITQALPPAQTYSDLHEEQPMASPPQQPQQQERQPREIPFQDPSIRVADRGRQASREPQYDSVPIPGGYSLVRGQGAVPVSTDYDPRGLNRMQQPVDPRYAQQPPNGKYLPNGVPTQGPPQQYMNDGRQGPDPRQSPPVTQEPRQIIQPKPRLGALETYETYTNRTAPRRLSREDLLARSPPKSLEGQQRPYQISLPGGDDEEGRPVLPEKDHPPPTSNPTISKQVRPQHGAVQRLQQPMIRHPESPAGYPLPEDTVFSPINPGANDIPPPPLPQWPGRQASQHLETSHLHIREASLSTLDGDLDRSSTRRTAVSAISGLSGPHANLDVPNRQISDATEKDRASSSPSPPTPNMSGDDIRTTQVEVRASKDDIYDASPRLPKQGHMLPRELTQISTSNSTVRTSSNRDFSGMTNSNGRHLQPDGKENSVNRSFSAVNAPPPATSMRDGQVVRAASAAQAEEKIPYRDHTAGRAELPVRAYDDEPEMSAVSYPGMEWNPYSAGAWDDGFD